MFEFIAKLMKTRATSQNCILIPFAIYYLITIHKLRYLLEYDIAAQMYGLMRDQKVMKACTTHVMTISMSLWVL